MPAFIPAENTVKCVLRQSYLGEENQNIIWLERSIPLDGVALAAIATALASWWSVVMAPLKSVLHSLYQIDVIGQDAANSQAYISAVNTPGTDEGEPLPGNTALVISFRTYLRGKSFRGRFYAGGITESSKIDTDLGNQVSAAYLASNLAAFEALMATYIAIYDPLFSHVVSSHFTGKLPRAFAFNSPVIEYTGDVYLDSQRRRLHGRGI